MVIGALMVDNPQRLKKAYASLDTGQDPSLLGPESGFPFEQRPSQGSDPPLRSPVRQPLPGAHGGSQIGI